MTNSINTIVTQKGTWSGGGVYNSTGGKDSVPESFSITPVTNTSLRIETRRSGGNTTGYNKRTALSPPLKPTVISFYRSSGVSPAGYTKTVSQSPTTTYDYVNSSLSGVSGSSASVIGFRAPTTGEIASLSAKSGNKLLGQVKDQTFNSGQAMAERRQTANLIGNTAIRIASSIRNLRKGNFAKAAEDLGVQPRKRAQSRFNKSYARRQGEAVSRGWLELQYGWKPLLNDVYGSAEVLAKKNVTATYTTRRVANSLTIDLSKNTVSTSAIKMVNTISTNGQVIVTVKYAVTYRNPAPAQSLPTALGLTNPLLIAWELVPFSFVVDWFLPVGQAISSLDATIGAEFYSGYKTVFWKGSGMTTITAHGVDASNRRVNSMTTSTLDVVSYERTPLAAFPTPSMPRFKNPASFIHAANGLALLSQLFKKR